MNIVTSKELHTQKSKASFLTTSREKQGCTDPILVWKSWFWSMWTIGNVASHFNSQGKRNAVAGPEKG